MIKIKFHKDGTDGFDEDHDMIEVPRVGDRVRLDHPQSFFVHWVEWHPNPDQGFEVYVVLR